MTPIQKIICAVLLFAAWGALVMMHDAPADQFVTGVRDALIALGVFTAAVTNQKK